MKIIYYPHKGENRAGEGERWKSGLKWGADFMLENIIKNAQEHEITPYYNLDWNNIKDSDVIWFHNIATTAYYNIPIISWSPIPYWYKKRNRPILIGGVRGLVGFERSKRLLKYFDAIHTGSVELYEKSKIYNKNCYVLYPGVDTDLFKPSKKQNDIFVVGWVGDKNKKMKNYQIIEKLGYQYRIASKDNYIPHEKMPEFYSSLSVYTHFSSHEGGNRTILEACSCGLPVISTNAGAVDKYIDEEWIIQYRDDEEYLIKEFKKRLMILEDDPDLRSIIGKSNRDRVLQYDWKNITNKWVKIIEEVYGRVKNK
jgi:glycosyltransferase involved in cell wall biosynthesis